MAGSSYWDKFTNQRITRRRALQSAGVAGAAAGAIWLVGCGGGDDDDNGTNGSSTPGGNNGGDEGTPKAGGRYSVGSTADFDTFDPYIGIAASVGYFPRLYNVLANFSALDSSFRFDDLSTGYEQPDDTKYVFAIRPGVKVGPNPLGVPERDLNAQDVVTSYERIKSLPQSNAYAFIGKWLAAQEASADGMTYTFTATGPYAFFRNRIGSPINMVAPVEALTDANIGKLRSQAAGAGPYTLRDYAEGQGATLDKNPNYYRKDEKNNNAQIPYVDGIDVKIITDRAAIRTAFQTNQLSVYTAETVDEANQLNQGDQYNEVRDPVNTFIAFTMNPTKDPWKDDRIRKAANFAIDREAYVKTVYNGEAKANGIYHWPLGDLCLPDDQLKEYQRYDPAEAKKLIQAATGNDTVKIKMMYPAESTIEQHNLHLPIFLQQMKDAGFDVEEEPLAFATWLDRYTNLDYDSTLALNQVYEYAEFNMDWQHSEGPARNKIYATGIGSLYPEIDAEIDRVKGITDPEEFKQASWDLQKMIYEKGPAFLPLVSPYSFTLYQKYVKGITEGIGASALFLNDWWLDL
ncbi:MAG TPA: ABC transporter substrate-binding protein [Dehalococcoidia bacterium]|jgi:ABC-type transport system substrate-binding protein|nr:ABC transporter substrate-binding protein [Dehalococcoidia bacterium]